LRAATLCLATVLATPYLLDYDLVILALPIAWLALDGKSRGFLTWEKSVLFALWILPLVSRATGSVLHIPLGAPILILGFAIALRRAAAEVNRGIGANLLTWSSVLGG
jgi:alpha-1,2-mannosyltransferase